MKQIENKIAKNKQNILKLLNENIDLSYNLNLQRATRIEEVEVNRGTKKVPVMVKTKRMYWNEWFKDEDKPNEKGIKIERSMLIEVNGERTDEYGRPISYFTEEDL